MVAIRTLSLLVLVGIILCFCASKSVRQRLLLFWKSYIYSDSVNGVGPLLRFLFRNQALQAAKRINNIPRGQQPIQTIRVPDKNTGQMLRQYDYINNRGQKISIRQDLPRNYGHPLGVGNQGYHFNAGPSGGKLQQHYYFERFNRPSNYHWRFLFIFDYLSCFSSHK